MNACRAIALVLVLLAAAPSVAGEPLSLWMLGDAAAKSSGLRSALQAAFGDREVRLVGTFADSVALPGSIETLCDMTEDPDVIVFSVGPDGTDATAKASYERWRQAAWTVSVLKPEADLVLTTAIPAGDDVRAARVAELNALIREEMTGRPRVTRTFPPETAFVDLEQLFPRRVSADWRPDLSGLSAEAAARAAGHLVRALKPSVHLSGASAAPGVSAGGAERHVPGTYRSGFVHQRTLEIAERQKLRRGEPPAYTWVNEGPDAIDRRVRPARIAYYLELVHRGTGLIRYVWCDMESFGGTFADMEIPTRVTHLRRVRQLHVFSNAPGVRNIPSADDAHEGFVEFSPLRYGPSGVDGYRPPASAPKGVVSWGDCVYPADPASYGCLQIFCCHDAYGEEGLPELLFAWNRFTCDEDAPMNEIGIGPLSWRNGAFRSEDWTHTAETPALNAAAYSVRHLEIWTRMK